MGKCTAVLLMQKNPINRNQELLKEASCSTWVFYFKHKDIKIIRQYNEQEYQLWLAKRKK